MRSSSMRETSRPMINEDQLEKAITDYLNLVLPDDAVMFHIPNGGYKLTGYELGKLKRAGYIAGIPDRCILYNGKAFFIEAKAPGKKPSAKQIEMHDRMRFTGIKVAVVNSVRGLQTWLQTWNIPLKTHIML